MKLNERLRVDSAAILFIFSFLFTHTFVMKSKCLSQDGVRFWARVLEEGGSIADPINSNSA